MTCKDCIHFEVCLKNGDARPDIKYCSCFKDKSRYIELPCEEAERALEGKNGTDQR